MPESQCWTLNTETTPRKSTAPGTARIKTSKRTSLKLKCFCNSTSLSWTLESLCERLLFQRTHESPQTYLSTQSGDFSFQDWEAALYSGLRNLWTLTFVAESGSKNCNCFVKLTRRMSIYTCNVAWIHWQQKGRANLKETRQWGEIKIKYHSCCQPEWYFRQLRAKIDFCIRDTTGKWFAGKVRHTLQKHKTRVNNPKHSGQGGHSEC